jgi:hypothetical protein
MLLFRVEERKGYRPFQKGKGARGVVVGSCTKGQLEDAVARWRLIAGVGWRLD